MAGLVPAIHVFPVQLKQDVDARHEAGHDELVVTAQHTIDNLLRRIKQTARLC
jgi:hypothetical protein